MFGSLYTSYKPLYFFMPWCLQKIDKFFDRKARLPNDTPQRFEWQILVVHGDR